MEGERPRRRVRPRWPLLFLLAPFVALLYPPWYESDTPELWGIPFFVWYQFLWVIVGALCTYLAYRFRD